MVPQQRGQKHEKLEPPRAIVCLFVFIRVSIKTILQVFLNNLFETFGQGNDTRISPRQKGKKINTLSVSTPPGTAIITTIKQYQKFFVEGLYWLLIETTRTSIAG